jgi:hypothetical protein
MTCPSCGGSRWIRYLAERYGGTYEEAFALCASCPDDAGRGEPVPAKPEEVRNDLWLVPKAFDHGPEGNAQLWKLAGVFLSALGGMVAAWGEDPAVRNDALVVALTDCRERVQEEIRRAEAETGS